MNDDGEIADVVRRGRMTDLHITNSIEKPALRSLGFNMGVGMIGGIGVALFAGAFLVAAAQAIWPPAHDATDPINGRSGLKLYTDHGTGCQYLARPGAGIVPRLDRSGKPMCGEGG